MELNDVLLRRRSVRNFKEDPIPADYIDELMHAAMSGPSACNKTPWDFYVITNPDILDKLRTSSAYTRYHAPLAIVVCGNLSRSLPQQLAPYWIQDCSAATENILLKATDLGLGAVWCGIHPQKKAEQKVSNILSLFPKQIPLNIIFVGYPISTPEPRDQYTAEYIHYII